MSMEPTNVSDRVSVSPDLRFLCSIDTASEKPAAHADPGDTAVEVIWRAVEDLYRTGVHPALSFCLRHKGSVVLNRALGYAQGSGPGDPVHGLRLPATPETPVNLCSASKAVTATLIHMLAEEGRIELDHPVAHYLPEFGIRGKAKITIAHVLSHRGGIPNFRLPRAQRRLELLTDWNRNIKVLCAMAPSHAGKPAYHAFTSGYILGEVVQRATGDTLRDYLDQRLRQPLGMKHFTYGLPREYRDMAARNYLTGTPVRWPVSWVLQRALLAPIPEITAFLNTAHAMESVVPSGNLFATAEELSRFYQMLLDGGIHDGRQIMQAATVARLIRPVGGAALDRNFMLPVRYSEGMMLGGSPYGLYGPGTTRAFGHLGFTNILSWADPDRNVSCALLLTGKAFFGTHLTRLWNLLDAISRECRPAQDQGNLR